MKKTNLVILIATLLLIVCICLGLFLNQQQEDDYVEEVEEVLQEQIEDVVTEPTEEPEIEIEEVDETYVSPIDFEALWEINPDIYAWIEIENTVVDYPILNRADDNSYYLRKNIYEEYDSDGVIFTEDYNSLDFNDPVTLIYGHNLASGDMFGSLQEVYTNLETFLENNTVTVYLPDETKQYQIFAAVSYGTKHILYYNDFSDEEVFNAFLEEIYNTRSLNSVIDDSVTVTNTDNLIILSTCLSSSNSSDGRYLVLAVEITE